MLKSKNKIRSFGYIGLAASIVVGIGEFLVHFSNQGYAGAENFQWLKRSEHSIVLTGHYMMLMGMPLYTFGYYHFYLAFRDNNRRHAQLLLVLGITAFSIGGVWGGSRALLTEIVKSENAILLDYYKVHYEILVNILRLLILFISMIWVALVGFSRSNYPRWMAFFNPAVILATVFLIYLIAQPIGKFLVPTAMNVSHFVLFTLSLITLKKTLST